MKKFGRIRHIGLVLGLLVLALLAVRQIMATMAGIDPATIDFVPPAGIFMVVFMFPLAFPVFWQLRNNELVMLVGAVVASAMYCVAAYDLYFSASLAEAYRSIGNAQLSLIVLASFWLVFRWPRRHMRSATRYVLD